MNALTLGRPEFNIKRASLVGEDHTGGEAEIAAHGARVIGVMGH